MPNRHTLGERPGRSPQNAPSGVSIGGGSARDLFEDSVFGKELWTAEPAIHQSFAWTGSCSARPTCRQVWCSSDAVLSSESLTGTSVVAAIDCSSPLAAVFPA